MHELDLCRVRGRHEYNYVTSRGYRRDAFVVGLFRLGQGGIHRIFGQIVDQNHASTRGKNPTKV